MHTLILDSTNDQDDWVAVLARCVGVDGWVQVVQWDLLCMQDAKSDTFVDTIMGLYERDNVDVRKVVGMATDGCTIMKSAVRKFERWAGLQVIWCHCLAHRLDLALSTDVWGHSELCKSVEEAMRSAYTMLYRSSQRRKELQALAVEFIRVNVPAALIDIRWLSKLHTLEVFASPGTSAALKEYINAKEPASITLGEAKVIDVLENHAAELQDLLRMLRPLARPTKLIQSRQLDLPGTFLLLQ